MANVLPGAGNGVVVGPFTWTPTEVGHECTLVMVECAQDRAVTQDLLATDHLEHSELVPFDNNIAQRNLVPVQAKGKTNKGFWVRNPFRDEAVIRLHFEDTLPRGWAWHAGGEREFTLQPRERRWVDLAIDQAGGDPVKDFERPQQVRIAATANGKPIGGMTFYVAPPSAFAPTGRDEEGGTEFGDGSPAHPHHGEHGRDRHHGRKLLGIEFRWSLLDLKGDVGFRVALDGDDD